MLQVNFSTFADLINMPLYCLRKGKLVEDQAVLSDLKYTKVSLTYKLPDKVSVNVEIGKYI